MCPTMLTGHTCLSNSSAKYIHPSDIEKRAVENEGIRKRLRVVREIRGVSREQYEIPIPSIGSKTYSCGLRLTDSFVPFNTFYN